jgi:hypothetical protein
VTLRGKRKSNQPSSPSGGHEGLVLEASHCGPTEDCRISIRSLTARESARATHSCNQTRTCPVYHVLFDLLQWLAALLYLLNKIFLWLSERSCNEVKARKWRVASWSVYLAGLPPWIIIFSAERNWIAASVEASGAPAMLLGLIMSLHHDRVSQEGLSRLHPGEIAAMSERWLNRSAVLCIPLGFAVSLYDFGGLNTKNQVLEIGLVAGFLIGTYLLAWKRPSGYLWYVLMHVSCGALMWIQNYVGLTLQQAISLVFIVAAYRAAKRAI